MMRTEQEDAKGLGSCRRNLKAMDEVGTPGDDDRRVNGGAVSERG